MKGRKELFTSPILDEYALFAELNKPIFLILDSHIFAKNKFQLVKLVTKSDTVTLAADEYS